MNIRNNTKDLDSPENARKWQVHLKTNVSISIYTCINLRNIKDTMRTYRANPNNKDIPTIPVEPWVLLVAFSKFEDMKKQSKHKEMRLMCVDISPV